MDFDDPVFFNLGSTITHIHVYIWLHDLCVLYFPIIAVIMSVFSSPTGSPACPDLDQTYPISLSDDLREDALHDLLQRIDMHEGLVSPNAWSSRETELW